MNTKKNKNKNKPKPNLNPPQTEILQKVEEPVKDEPKSDERVPEIVSEIVAPVKVKCTEADLPKKPKRNRGKKKKDEEDSEFEQPVAENVTEQTEAIQSNVEKAEEPPKETKKEELPPTTRKNKNKGKKGDQSDKLEIKPLSPLPVSPILDTVESEIKPATPELPGEESKSAKKKNKKKKRHDSEKSEKAEEISCTAAFMKILEPREDKKDIKSNIETSQIEIAPKPKEPEVEIKTPEPVPKTKEITPQPEIPKDEDGKGKKKNKKDKKHQPKIEAESQAPIQTADIQVEEIASLSKQEEIKYISKPAVTELPKDQCLTKLTLSEEASAIPVIEKEKSPKPKPKIAKPVDKKKKDNTEDNPIKTESVPTTEPVKQENVCLDMILREEPKNTPVELVEVPKQAVIPLPGIEDLKVEMKEMLFPRDIPPESSMPEPIEEMKQTEHISVPQNGACKKRKKSPKPKRDKYFMPFQTDSSSTTATPIVSDFEIKPTETIPAPVEITEIPKEETIPEPKDQMMAAVPLVFEPIPESSEFKKYMIEKPIEPDAAKTNEQMPMPSSSKKGRRSPKPSKKLDMKIAEEDVKKTSEQDTTKKDDKQSIETPFDLPVLEEIEIRSVKDESDGSVCELAPEVQHPRASSLIKDSNNNQTVIQEVATGTASQGISEPPFIQGSGETPIPTPEIIPGGLRITEIETKKTEEKTDIKSKMMEVNKDMEDLRKSIERSLAEFTSIEKSEKEVEQKFEEKQSKIAEKKAQDTAKIIEKPEEKQVIAQETVPVKPGVIEEPKPENDIPKIIETEPVTDTTSPPVVPARKDNKGKNKSKKGKGKHGSEQTTTTAVASESGVNVSTTGDSKSTQDSQSEKKTEQKSETKEKGKQQSDNQNKSTDSESKIEDDSKADNEPIESFDDALTSSTDDVNKSFEIISNDASGVQPIQDMQSNTQQCSVTEPDEEKIERQEKNNPVTQPKNLLGHPDIPARLNKTDYKKEKNKPPNTRQARVKIKDANPVEVKKESKQSQTDSKRLLKHGKSTKEAVTCIANENEEYVYKYSFRKVFLPSACQVCKKDLSQARVACGFCNLIFYCSPKHKDEDYPQHQALCFAISTIVHLKDEKHIYANCQNITGQDYRLLRMQNIISCEKILKRSLAAWEQEVLLYPRLCADVGCREWRQGLLKDCDGCGQISFCKDTNHLPVAHQKYCKSYLLYKKLVTYQQTIGRLEPKLPTRVMKEHYQIPEKFNEVLASLYEEKIDMNDIQYATLTQIATAPLTAAYCYQLYSSKMNSTFANGNIKKSTFTIHVVNAELQFEADALNKWEVFFLHLRPDLVELKVVLIGKDLNPSNLPLELLGKLKMCDHCRQNHRRVMFEFQDKKTYPEYFASKFSAPDLVCTFNPSIQRCSIYNGKDVWPSTINCITKLKTPLIITSYTSNELIRDIARVKEISESNINVVLEPMLNTFASVRPDRNFITDDEIPLLFKNYSVSVVCGDV